MAMSLYDWAMQYERKKQALAEGGITKATFGKMMHDPNVSEEDKQKILKEVEKQGGYECLA